MPCRDPFVLSAKDSRFGVPLYVPCGKCVDCRKSRAFSRYVRGIYELTNNRAYFLTLTYSDDKICDESLDIRDFQLFMKKLRKRFPNAKLRYIVSGEYGESSGRKHYHAVLFGLPSFSPLSSSSCTYCYNRSSRPCHDVCDCWNLGRVQFVPCSPEALSYVVGYVSKKIFDDRHVENYGLRKPFVYSSRNLGVRAFEASAAQVAKLGGIPLMQGKRLGCPPAFKKVLEKKGLYGQYLYNRCKFLGSDPYEWKFKGGSFVMPDQAASAKVTLSRSEWQLQNPVRSALKPIW